MPWYSSRRRVSGSIGGAAALACVLLMACATSRPDAEAFPPVPETPTPIAAVAPPAAPPAPPAAAPQPTCDAFVRPGVLRRRAVVRVVDAGLGRWLAGGADVERKLAKARFQGWRIVRLYPDDPCYRQVDLRPGDVVTKVNGRSVERPEQAAEVLAGLRSGPELVVDYLRDGQDKKLVLSINDE
jgi:hypothetical protein